LVIGLASGGIGLLRVGVAARTGSSLSGPVAGFTRSWR